MAHGVIFPIKAAISATVADPRSSAKGREQQQRSCPAKRCRGRGAHGRASMGMPQRERSGRGVELGRVLGERSGPEASARPVPPPAGMRAGAAGEGAGAGDGAAAANR